MFDNKKSNNKHKDENTFHIMNSTEKFKVSKH